MTVERARPVRWEVWAGQGKVPAQVHCAVPAWSHAPVELRAWRAPRKLDHHGQRRGHGVVWANDFIFHKLVDCPSNGAD